MSFARLGFMTAALLPALAVGCKKKVAPTPPPRASASASAVASALAAPSASVAELADAAVEDAAAVNERTVAAGTTPTGFHCGAFALKTLPESPGLAFDKAIEACAAAGKFLCSETEWALACAATPDLAASETWTYSAERDRVVVRGGDGNCEKRAVVNPAETNATRATLCCDRAIGATGGLGDAAEKIAAQLVTYEKGLRERKVEDLVAVTLESLIFAGKELKREELLPASLAALLPDAAEELTLFDACTLRPDDAGGATNLECSAARLRPTGPEELRWKLATLGPEHRLTRIELPERVAPAEQKQRVGGFLPSTR